LVLTLLGKKTESMQRLIDVREAFNLWDILNSKYVAVEKLKIWNNGAHDPELKLLIKYFEKSLGENIAILEREMDKFSVKSPDQNRSAIKLSGGAHVVTDEYIAGDIFLYLQEHTENLLGALGTSMTNDSLRKKIVKMTKKTIKEADRFLRYLKLKGWTETPPLYKSVLINVSERLSTAEVASLWDHLTFRYTNIYTTQLFHDFAHDYDFKKTLDMGLNALERQVDVLEKEAEHFGIPFPQRPAKVNPTPENTEILDDDHMYRTLLIGFQSAAIIHVRAFKQCTFNDRVRGIFKDLLFEQIGLTDDYYKYGKMKGWLNPMPTYGP